MGDRRKCQTYTASPAEPGGLPVMLEPFPFRLNRNGALFLVLTRFLRANRYPPRIKSGAGFRWKTL